MFNKRGQIVTSEYVVTFFIVIAAMVAMTAYMQRGVQGKIRDARNYMVDRATDGCRQAGGGQVNCMNALSLTAMSENGPQFPYEYEPYYANVTSSVAREVNDTKTSEIRGISRTKLLQETQVNTTSEQLPPARSQ